MNGRNPFALAALAPGVAPGQNLGNNPLLLANLGINGGRGGATEILIDGSSATVPENSPGSYATAVMPSVDRIQEFKVQTNSFSAESGRLGIGPRASTEQRRSLGPRRSGCSPGPCPLSSLQPPGDWPGSHQQFHCRRQRSKRRRQLRRPLPPPLHGHPYDLLPLELPRPGRSAAWHHNWTIKPNLLSDISISDSDLFTRRQSHSFGTNINEALGLPRELGALGNHGGLTTFVVPGFGALGESFLARFRLQSYGL